LRSFKAHCQDGETHTNLYEDFRPRGVTSKALTTGIDEVVYSGDPIVMCRAHTQRLCVELRVEPPYAELRAEPLYVELRVELHIEPLYAELYIGPRVEPRAKLYIELRAGLCMELYIELRAELCIELRAELHAKLVQFYGIFITAKN